MANETQMAKDSVSKEEKKRIKEEKLKNKMMEKEEKKRIKEEKKKKTKDDKGSAKSDPNTDQSETDTVGPKPSKSVEAASSYKNTDGSFKFMPSRFVMPRGKKGYVFPMSPGPARYPITRVNYPIMRARRQRDLTKKMLVTIPTQPAYTMGIRHTEYREFYNKIQ